MTKYAKRYEFSLQYPKPLKPSELSWLNEVATSGLYSRYSNDIVTDLESELSDYYETGYAVTCTSGTAALHGCLTALDLPKGSEIITTSVADVGVVIPIMYENLIPVFADVDPQTYNITTNSIEEKITKKTEAVIAVHLAGNPCDLDALSQLCTRHDLILIEDFSQAHGAKWKGKKIGSLGLISYGSFQQSKQITCGEGGVILTNDANLANRALIGVDKGWQRDLPLEERYYEFLAPNVRFNAIQAAILKPQISRLNDLIESKRERARILYQMLIDYNEYVQPQKILEGASHSYYSFPLFMNDNSSRTKLLKILNQDYNVYCAKGYANPLTLYMCVNALIDPERYGKGLKYSDRKYPVGTCPNAEELLERSFLIPFNENFSIDEIEDLGHRLVNAFKDIF